MIKACGNEEVKRAVFEAVRGGETDISLEFLKVCSQCGIYSCWPYSLYFLEITMEGHEKQGMVK